MNEQNNDSLNNLVAPDSYILLAIFSTLFCFFPLGIIALIYSIKVMILWKNAQYEKARIASDQAFKYGQLAIFAGVLFWIIFWLVK